ncbi:MAG: ArnT family glycosyltransferase [Armatimonadota bacterium]
MPAALLAALAALLLLPGLGSTHLVGEDEARYADTARNMVRSGNWTVPRFNGQLRAQKPILIYWLLGGAYKLFGANEFSARLCPALTGVLLALTTFLFAAPHLGGRTALVAGIFLAVCPAMFTWGRMAVTDMPLALFVSFGILAAFHATESSAAAKARWHCAAAAALALGTLMKGPVAPLIALMVMIPYLLLRRGLRAELRAGGLVPAVLIFLAIAAPWYLIVTLRTRGEFAEQFFLAENILRYFRASTWQRGPLYLYLPVCLVVFLPWSGLLPYALWRGFRTRRRASQDSGHRLRLLSTLWFAVVFLFFTFSQAKLISYVLPLAPAAAILVAIQWEEWRRGLAGRFGFYASTAFAALLLAAVAAFLFNLPGALRLAQQHVFSGLPTPDFAGAHYVAGGGLALSLLAWALLCLLRRADLVPWALAGGMGLTAIAMTGPMLRAMDRAWQAPLSRAAQQAGQMAPPQARLAVTGLELPSLVVYYGKRRVYGLRDLEQLGLRGPRQELWIVAPLRIQAQLRDHLGAELTISEPPYGVYIARPSNRVRGASRPD